MNEYDEVELIVDQPQWALSAGARGAVVDAVPGEDFVAVEFFRPNEENVVHLTPIHFLRVTDQYATPTSLDPITAHSRPERT